MATADMSLQNKHLRNGDYFAIIVFLLTNYAKNGQVGAP